MGWVSFDASALRLFVTADDGAVEATDLGGWAAIREDARLLVESVAALSPAMLLYVVANQIGRPVGWTASNESWRDRLAFGSSPFRDPKTRLECVAGDSELKWLQSCTGLRELQDDPFRRVHLNYVLQIATLLRMAHALKKPSRTESRSVAHYAQYSSNFLPSIVTIWLARTNRKKRQPRQGFLLL